MSAVVLERSDYVRVWPGWWRMTVIALSTLVLCSCRAAPNAAVSSRATASPDAEPPASEPTTIVTPHVMTLATVTPAIPRTCDTSTPAYVSGGSCAACGLCKPACPTPYDELLCDGGDIPPGVLVSPEWRVYGLDETDAVAHYDSIDGRTLVEPSNRVCIYAPRFGAVRVVTRIISSEQIDVIEGATQPLRIQRHDDVLIANTNTQNLQPLNGQADRLPESFESRQHEGLLTVRVIPRAVQDALLPYENLSIIKVGAYQNSEKAWLAQVVDAALVWSNVQAPQVQLEHQAAQVLNADQKTQLTYTVDLPQCPKLRLVKVASTVAANPGEFVDFTLRFDNVGDQAIGNVVILDDLTARLEFVPGSEQSSVDATFSTSPNEHGSLVVRWEITKPLLPGEGGIVKFRTRVR